MELALVYTAWQRSIPLQVLIQELNLIHTMLITSCKYNLLHSSPTLFWKTILTRFWNSPLKQQHERIYWTNFSTNILLVTIFWFTWIYRFEEVILEILKGKSKERNLIIKPQDEVRMGPMQCHWFQDDGWYCLKSVVSLKSG